MHAFDHNLFLFFSANTSNFRRWHILKQPLVEHKDGSCTNSSKEIKSKVCEACCKNETQNVTYFFQRKRNTINTKKLDEIGSLFVAVENSNLLILDELLNFGCNPDSTNSNGKPSFLVALLNGNMCIANSLLKHANNVFKLFFYIFR